MRKPLWLALMLVMFVPGFALLGTLVAVDNRERTPWLGITAGVLVGLFFALVFGGALPRRWMEAIFGAEERVSPPSL